MDISVISYVQKYMHSEIKLSLNHNHKHIGQTDTDILNKKKYI